MGGVVLTEQAGGPRLGSRNRISETGASPGRGPCPPGSSRSGTSVSHTGLRHTQSTGAPDGLAAGKGVVIAGESGGAEGID